MDSIKRAIEEFKNRRLGVYKADPDQIVRDSRAAERATKDHVGRWLFELLQNSDDAKASEVRIIIGKDSIYIADNGYGLQPEAVSAICGTDFSDKTTGTIGRKGVGFKSVYEVTRYPQVLTVNGVGIEFSPEKTKAWLSENRLNDGHLPYQWVPFFIPWGDAQRKDPQLDDLKAMAFKTVVRLPGLSPEKKQKVEQMLREWPPHALFAFRHLRKITAPGLEVVLSAGNGIWSLHDSRGQAPVEWSVIKHTERPPAALLEFLGADERQAVSTDGVGFLIAAPLENIYIVPTLDYLPVHVFYPTEQNGPVRLLLHAEFLVKSDRTAIMPVNDNRFNAWVADRLADHVRKFVNDSYHPLSPSGHVALLVPFAERSSHPVAEALWRRIADKAQESLRLADVGAQQRLMVSEARLISVSVRADLARTLLEATSVRGRLLHSSFDKDKEARKALSELGCKEIHDQDLLAAIAENADSLATETQWVWTCWEWLADWAAKEPYGEEHRKRIEQARSLPIVPIEAGVVKVSDLTGRIVTWKPDTAVDNLPEWLPLTFVADSFRDCIQNEAEQESPVRKLRKELGIDEPDADVIQRAVGQAIEQYWEKKQGDPGRFLRFILEQDWHDTDKVPSSLQRCPVPLSQPVQDEAWAEAGKAYFGSEWGNELLAELYNGNGVAAVAWAANDGTSLIDSTRRRRVLEWLGVANCPRILEECRRRTVWQLPDGCGLWKQYLNTARDHCGRHIERIAAVSQLNNLTIADLGVARGVLLIRLIARYWAAYYRDHIEVTAEGTQGREQYYRSWQVKAKWWWEVCERLPLPERSAMEDHIALTRLWLPDKRTERAIGGFLRVIDVDVFGIDKDDVCEWLISAIGLRTRIEQVTIVEWKALLSRQIPDKAPSDRLVSEGRLRDRVTGWYAACLETVAEQETVLERVFESCPLLCRKGNIWQYVKDELRYLDDDNDLGAAFAEDVWLFHIPARLADDAIKYLGVLPLSKLVEVNVTPGEPQSPLQGELRVRFNESLPYVWAWRSSQSKQAANRLSVRLKDLEVLIVPTLKASLTLDGLCHEVERRWHVNDHTIYLHEAHLSEAELAQALAKVLDLRSEADFYENLFRCTEDRQRKQKLLSKGIVDAEIDRCLREYSGQHAEEEPDEGSAKSTKGEQGDSTSQATSGGGTQGQQRKQSTAKQPFETSEVTAPNTSESGKPSLRLKDPSTTPYVLGSLPSGDAGTGRSGDGGGTERERHSLTDTEKAELEEIGRSFAVCELESMDYSVEKMPPGNPGFDLRARKNGDDLHVEVKAHSGRATIVDVTQREYKEYLGQQGYRWELWNVEHLAENDPSPVVITRYNKIPDDALDVRTFRVDLKRCENLGSDS